jgi:hypothetical protein
MENPTEFDLNTAISRWRNQLALSPALRAEDVAELESHARDATATLASRGLSEEEAWLIAARRVGGGAVLEAEFAKVNRSAVWLDRLLWMLLGVQGWGLLRGLSSAAAHTVVCGFVVGTGVPLGPEPEFGANLLPGVLFILGHLFALALCIGALVWCVRLPELTPAGWLRRLLSRPLAFGMMAAAIILLQLGVQSLVWAGDALWMRWMEPSQWGPLMTCGTTARVLVGLVQSVAIVALTVGLVRRRVRQTC